MPCYKSSESIMTAACYKSGNNNDESDNNKVKVCPLLKRWGLGNHVLHHMLNHVLNHMLDHIIINLIIMMLYYHLFKKNILFI